MQNQIVEKLKNKKLILSSAESFTAGNIASSIISVSGASQVFYEGLVCYNTEAKIDRLGIAKETIKRFGVVSPQVAEQMVKGLLKTNKCDIGISSTGYADINDDGKQVGLTYIAVGDIENIIVEENTFCGTRKQITELATQRALKILLNFINERK